MFCLSFRTKPLKSHTKSVSLPCSSDYYEYNIIKNYKQNYPQFLIPRSQFEKSSGFLLEMT